MAQSQGQNHVHAAPPLRSSSSINTLHTPLINTIKSLMGSIMKAILYAEVSAL